MSRFSSVLAPGEPKSTYFTLATVTASAEQALSGTSQLIAFCADQDMTIVWGTAGSVATPSLSVGQYFPAKAVYTFDSSRQFTAFKVFNISGSTANVYWWHVSVV